MLENILTTISKKSDQKVELISRDTGRAILALEENFKENLKEKKDQEKITLKDQTIKEIQEFEQIQDLRVKFKVEGLRAEMVEEVFSQAKKAISELQDHDFTKVIGRLLGAVPENKQGIFLAGPRTVAVLNSLSADQPKIKAELKEEGFIFKSQEMEVDFRISQVVDQLKETVVSKVVKALFNKE